MRRGLFDLFQSFQFFHLFICLFRKILYIPNNVHNERNINLFYTSGAVYSTGIKMKQIYLKSDQNKFYLNLYRYI